MMQAGTFEKQAPHLPYAYITLPSTNQIRVVILWNVQGSLFSRTRPIAIGGRTYQVIQCQCSNQIESIAESAQYSRLHQTCRCSQNLQQANP